MIKPLKGLYNLVGSISPKGIKAGEEAFQAAYKTALAASRPGRIPLRSAGNVGRGALKARQAEARVAGHSAQKIAQMQAGKRPARIGMGVLAAGSYTTMRHHSSGNGTPSTQTAKGVGRYA